MQRHRPKAIVLAVMACAATAAAVLPGTNAAASSARLAIGPSARLPLFSAVTHALTTQTLNLTVALKSQDPAGLLDYATAVSTPGSPDFRHYLTVAQFASRFGATATALGVVQSALRADGLTVGAASANDLAFNVTGSASTIDNALQTSIDQLVLPTGRTVIANLTAPTLPASVAGYVQGVIGMDNVTPATAAAVVSQSGTVLDSGGAHANIVQPRNATPHVTTGGPQPCPDATNASVPNAMTGQTGGYTADQLAAAYGFSGLYGSGDLGAGQTIGVVELTSFNPSDIATFQSCYGTNATINTINVGPGFGPFNANNGDDDGESALDIEVALSMAPQATIDVYQGDPTSAGIAEQAVVMNQMAAQDTAKVISSSYGECESATPSQAISMENTVLEEMASQGQTFFAAAGDSGSETCSQLGETLQNGQANPQWSPNVSVEDPSGQPFATAVGGTEMFSIAGSGSSQTLDYDRNGAPPSEVVWNEGTSPKCGCGGQQLDGFGGGGGGGVSQVFALPSYQSSYFTAVGQPATGGNAGCGSAQCREVPDVSADADGSTGYVVFVTVQEPIAGGLERPVTGWQVIGGTSAASPLWAAFMALVNAQPACRGVTAGFVDPALYKIASTAYATNFHDIAPIAALGQNQPTNNDTLFQFGVMSSTNTQSLYPETVGYDMATGLGSMIAPALAQSLCAQIAPVYTVSVAAPAAQTATAGRPFSLQLTGTDSGGASLTYTATGLPAGLSISPSGLISGTPTAVSSSTVAVTATDPYKNSAGASFSIDVVAAGKPSAHVGLSGVAGGRVKLSVSAGQGQNAPSLHAIAIGLPKGFTLARSNSALHRGLKVSSLPSTTVTASISGRTLTLTFASPFSTAGLTIRRPLVSVSRTLRRRVKHHRTRSLAFSLALTDADGVVSTGSFPVGV